MDLSIIIVNYKSKDKAVCCIQSIKNSDLDNINFEIIVLDNNSGSEELGEIKKAVGGEINIKYIQSNRNLGMGGGNNLAIKAALGKFILILNPDTIVRREAIKVLFQ